MNDTRVRVIPTLLLKDDSLVKSIKFKSHNYIGDPINTVRIFNELEVDELMFLDITATLEKRPPNFKLLEKIALECFMPLSYGGGLTNITDIKRVFDIGYEKIVLNSYSYKSLELLNEASRIYGSQAIISSVDYRKGFFGKLEIMSVSGSRKESFDLNDWLLLLEKNGAGEILLTSIDQEGTWAGYDLVSIERLCSKLSIPVIASGGAGSVEHLGEAIRAGASAVAVGSMIVFQKKGMGVLVNFPDKNKLHDVFKKLDFK